jgi:hypothetical protein
MLILFCSLLWVPVLGHDDNEFSGTVERMPESGVGTWVIGGRKLTATEQTEIEQDEGPVRVGTCVEVDYEGNKVEEIERKPTDKCDIVL